jgi:hypothetical protein
MQPAAHRGVVAEAAGVAVRGEQRILQSVVGVFGGLAASPGQPVQPGTVPTDQFGEGLPITTEMRREQAASLRVSPAASSLLRMSSVALPTPRTLTTSWPRGTSPARGVVQAGLFTKRRGR